MKQVSNSQEIILVSACLLGINCRYDGKNAYNKQVAARLRNKNIIFACPEQLGGLTTPRSRNIIVGDRVINEDGLDVTDNFIRGAKEFIKIARMFCVKKLILKSRSPSCGKRGIVTKLLSKKFKVEYKK
ncbi:MAG: DUF523 domain-containing protein [bacterium]